MNLSASGRGTRYFFGKPYHWTLTAEGVLKLMPGKSPVSTLSRDERDVLELRALQAEKAKKKTKE